MPRFSARDLQPTGRKVQSSIHSSPLPTSQLELHSPVAVSNAGIDDGNALLAMANSFGRVRSLAGAE